MSRPISDSLHMLPFVGPGRAEWHRVRLGSDGPDWPESWLRDRIAENPELVLGACRAFGFIDTGESWRLWDVELAIPGVGSVDVVLISSDGRVALVEVKLARNPENRRKVVAQLLDYAVHLREATLADLGDLPTEDGAPFAEADDVQRHLQEGDFLLVIAADSADDRAARLTRAVLDRNAIHPWDLVLVDLALFAPKDGAKSATELLCAPHVIGGVRCESRHVVEVKVLNTAANTSVVVTLVPPDPIGPEVIAWTRDTFQHTFQSLATSTLFRESVLAWLADVEMTTKTSIRYGTAKYPTALVQCGGQTFASADRDSIWIYGRESLKRAFGNESGEQRWQSVRTLFPDRPDMKQYFQVRATEPRIEKAIALVREWGRS